MKPAGNLIRSGLKTLEVRQWVPPHLPLRDLLIIQNETRLSSTGPTEDPEGIVMAVADVVAVREWTPGDLQASGSTEWERGWLAWELENVRPVNYPHLVTARLRIYTVELVEPIVSGSFF